MSLLSCNLDLKAKLLQQSEKCRQPWRWLWLLPVSCSSISFLSSWDWQLAAMSNVNRWIHCLVCVSYVLFCTTPGRHPHYFLVFDLTKLALNTGIPLKTKSMPRQPHFFQMLQQLWNAFHMIDWNLINPAIINIICWRACFSKYVVLQNQQNTEMKWSGHWKKIKSTICGCSFLFLFLAPRSDMTIQRQLEYISSYKYIIIIIILWYIYTDTLYIIEKHKNTNSKSIRNHTSCDLSLVC